MASGTTQRSSWSCRSRSITLPPRAALSMPKPKRLSRLISRLKVMTSLGNLFGKDILFLSILLCAFALLYTTLALLVCFTLHLNTGKSISNVRQNQIIMCFEKQCFPVLPFFPRWAVNKTRPMRAHSLQVEFPPSLLHTPTHLALHPPRCFSQAIHIREPPH